MLLAFAVEQRAWMCSDTEYQCMFVRGWTGKTHGIYRNPLLKVQPDNTAVLPLVPCFAAASTDHFGPRHVTQN